jgi:hypothetical protein
VLAVGLKSAESEAAAVADRVGGLGRAGISRDSLHKRRGTGGKPKPWRKKRKCVTVSVPSESLARSSNTGNETRHASWAFLEGAVTARAVHPHGAIGWNRVPAYPQSKDAPATDR